MPECIRVLAWAGVSIYWLALAIYQEHIWNQEAHNFCLSVAQHGFCNFYIGATGLGFYLVLSCLLLLLFALLTAVVLRLYRKWFFLSV